MMIKEREITNRRRRVCMRTASVLLALVFTVMSVSPVSVLAKSEKSPEKPLREVHKVGIDKSLYCFFVQHNVVLTPEEIAEKTTYEELNEYILDKAGLYLKESNCKLEKHKAIPIGKWKKKDAVIFLSAEDLVSIRTAEPADGEPLKMYMDLLISNEAGFAAEMEAAEEAEAALEEAEKPEEPEEAPKDADAGEAPDAEVTDTPEDAVNAEDTEETEDTEAADDKDDTGDAEEPEEEKPVPYSTYKLISPELIFIAVATKTDAESGEDICKDLTPSKNKDKSRRSSAPDGDSEDEEMLPEYRTIDMADRSGAPIEETLKDGDPVTLEWIEPKHNGVEGEASFTDRIPGGKTGLLVISVMAAAAAGAIVFAVKRNKADE